MIEAGEKYFRFYRHQGQIKTADISASIANGTFDSDILSWDQQIHRFRRNCARLYR